MVVVGVEESSSLGPKAHPSFLSFFAKSSFVFESLKEAYSLNCNEFYCLKRLVFNFESQMLALYEVY